MERLGGYLERTSGDELLRDAEDFARQRPWTVAGLGLLVGLAASRFLKASSERRYDSAQGNGYRRTYRYGYSHGPAGSAPERPAASSARAGELVATNEQSMDMRERPLGEVARDLTRDVSLLVRQEVELAKAEMAQKGRVAAPGLGMIGGAGVVGLMAAGALTAFLILVLSTFLPEWASALTVGVVLAAVAYVLAKQGKERVSEAGAPVPEQTIETVKEDVEWAKTRATSARS